MLADMDSTIIAEETLDELAAYAGIKDQIAAITARAMNGELDFHAALRERVSLLQGLEEHALAETLERMKVNDGAPEFIAAMRKSGATCVLVSGGFTFFTGAVADKVGFHNHHGNTLLIEGGKLTGGVGEPILDKDSKLAYLKDYAGKLGISLAETLTIGDGANDLPMLKAAGLGIGYYPKKAVADEVDSVIQYGDFTAALYAQGLVL
ncbi:MAG: phosphoserine phosphatase SerB [Alphaproteobacteria bacterium]|nr:phosphoserine phosphatase SerB [Alphaproteobacteria bacterium]